MKLIVVTILAASLGLFNNIARINKHKTEAERSYQNGNFQEALDHYKILVDSFKIQEEGVLMNYANTAYLLTNPTDNQAVRGLENQTDTNAAVSDELSKSYLLTAQDHYSKLAEMAQDNIKSLAFNQLGVIAFQSGGPQPSKENLTQAKGLFKSALKSNPQNEDARFNYELVSNLLKKEEEKQDQDQEQDQEKKDQEEQDKKDQEEQEQKDQKQEQEEQQSGEDQQEQEQSGEEQSEESDQKEGDPKESDEESSEQQEPEEAKPADMQQADPPFTKEKADMILEAMRNAEVQYIQQNKRKATKRPVSGKPDW